MTVFENVNWYDVQKGLYVAAFLFAMYAGPNILRRICNGVEYAIARRRTRG